MDNEHGELALELETLPDTDTRTGSSSSIARKCHPPLRSQRRLAWIVADASHILEDKPIDVFTLCSRGSRTVETATGSGPSGVESLGTSSNARKVSARLGRDLAFPRYFACRRARTWPGRMMRSTTTAAKSAAYRSAHIRWLSGSRLSAPIQARAKASLTIMA